MSYVKPPFSVISAILMMLFGLLKPVQRDFVVMWDCCTDLSRICGTAARLVLVECKTSPEFTITTTDFLQLVALLPNHPLQQSSSYFHVRFELLADVTSAFDENL